MENGEKRRKEEGEKEKGKKYKKDRIVWFDTYNLTKEVYLKQIQAAKGIDNYKGQVYHLFLDNKFLYPIISQRYTRRHFIIMGC